MIPLTERQEQALAAVVAMGPEESDRVLRMLAATHPRQVLAAAGQVAAMAWVPPAPEPEPHPEPQPEGGQDAAGGLPHHPDGSIRTAAIVPAAQSGPAPVMTLDGGPGPWPTPGPDSGPYRPPPHPYVRPGMDGKRCMACGEDPHAECLDCGWQTTLHYADALLVRAEAHREQSGHRVWPLQSDAKPGDGAAARARLDGES